MFFPCSKDPATERPFLPVSLVFTLCKHATGPPGVGENRGGGYGIRERLKDKRKAKGFFHYLSYLCSGTLIPCDATLKKRLASFPGIAVADMLVMLEYIPFTVHMNLWKDRLMEDRYSWSWAAFVWFHSNFSVVIHNVSVWLTLSLAVWRFIMIRSVFTLNDLDQRSRTLGNDLSPPAN